MRTTEQNARLLGPRRRGPTRGRGGEETGTHTTTQLRVPEPAGTPATEHQYTSQTEKEYGAGCLPRCQLQGCAYQSSRNHRDGHGLKKGRACQQRHPHCRCRPVQPSCQCRTDDEAQGQHEQELGVSGYDRVSAEYHGRQDGNSIGSDLGHGRAVHPSLDPERRVCGRCNAHRQEHEKQLAALSKQPRSGQEHDYPRSKRLRIRKDLIQQVHGFTPLDSRGQGPTRGFPDLHQQDTDRVAARHPSLSK